MDVTPPLTALRAFEAAARTGSLTKAGAELNVTHAAIAQQIRRLEAWFDAPLMRRAGRGVEVEPEAERLAAQLSAAFAAIQKASADFAARRAESPLKIAATPLFARHWLLPRLSRFSQRHPEIGFTIAPSTRTVDLAAAGFDIAFRWGDGDWPELDAALIDKSVMGVFASRALAKTLPSRRLADLARAPWVQEAGTDEVAAWLSAQGEAARPAVIVDVPGDYCLPAIKEGQGLGFAVRLWLEEEIAAGEIVQLATASAAPNGGYYLCTPKARLRPQAHAFATWAREEIAGG